MWVYLYSITGEPPADEVPLGPYPLEVTPDDDPEGKVLVVSDFAFGKYLGRLDVKFDDDGRVIDWGGNPILLDGSIAEGRPLIITLHAAAIGFTIHTTTKNVSQTWVKLLQISQLIP